MVGLNILTYINLQVHAMQTIMIHCECPFTTYMCWYKYCNYTLMCAAQPCTKQTMLSQSRQWTLSIQT